MIVALLRTMCVLGLLTLAVGLAVVGGYMGLFLSGSIGFVLMYMLIISLWMHRGDIVAERMVHQQRLQTGDQVEVTITISLPVLYWLSWMVVEEHWVQLRHNRTEQLQAIDEELEEKYACLAFIRGSRNIKFQYTTSAKARGLYRVHCSRVMIGDMFGLVRKVLVQAELDAEIVQINPQPLKGDWYKHMRRRADSPSDYSTLRDYMNGDPLSSIDWKSYARYQQLKTKQLELEESKSMLIVMDARKLYFENIVSAVMRIVMGMNDPSLEIILVCGDSRCLINSRGSMQQGMSSEIYEWLASIEAMSSDSFNVQLRTAIAHHGASISEGRVMIGLTASLDERHSFSSNNDNHQQSVQLIYIPPSLNGEVSYA